MPEQGYYRFPTVCGDAVVFVSEDDLWRVSLTGGVARRLGSSQGMTLCPRLSPDGKLLAYAGMEEGHPEVWIMPAEGGTPTRLTYLGVGTMPVAWSVDCKHVIFASNYNEAMDRKLYQVSVDGGEPEELPVGHANEISFGPKGCVIGRHTRDAARWKRYRGGTAGELWIDTKGKGEFVCLQPDLANVCNPMWIGQRVYFLSDHEGYANLYSCKLSGAELQRHTDHDEFYARNASTDGKNIVYHAGGDLFVYDVAKDQTRRIDIEYHSNFSLRARKYANVSRYLQGYDIHPDGAKTAVAVRGRIATLANWSGPVLPHGQEQGVRYRMPTWLQDGKQFVAISDEIDGEDRILTVNIETGKEKLLNKIWPGRVHDMSASPKHNMVAIENHRNELLLLDIDKKKLTVLDKSDHQRINGIAWSPDGRWVAYGFFNTPETCLIRVVDVNTGEKHDITDPLLWDVGPAFSPCGKYLYFNGLRAFDPVYDRTHFNIGFIKANKLYAVSLTKDAPDPFQPREESPAGDKKDNDKDEKKDNKDDEKKELKVEIDFDGIEKRLMPFPMPVGDYSNIYAHGKKVFFQTWSFTYTNKDYTDPAKSNLCFYDFEKQVQDTLIKNIRSYRLSLKGTTTIVRRENNKLSVYKTGEKPAEKPKKPFSKESGAIDMNRIKLLINPVDEWRQMYREAWLLQREHFWVSDMSGIDWELIYKRYLPLVDRLGSRAEFSDLIWEMQGELGTSHCYEFGGDYRPVTAYYIGKLGCGFELSSSGKYWVIRDIRYGDASDVNERSPLLTPGANIEEGDNLLAINGRPVDKDVSPRERLMNLAGQEVTLTVRKAGKRKTRDVTIRALKREYELQYREWVEKNRRYTHERSGGRVGYIHIPDMGWEGFAEFYRLYLSECGHDALLVDVRYNGGGHVSQLLLEKLARKPIGFDKTRWSQVPEGYPAHAVNGPICALTNEFAGSDGDIFSHSFKLMKLGKLIGKRTWGGVVGINSQYSLTDGAVTTQPEYSFWFKDVGWGVENYGTDPDIEVDITPQDYVAGRDPQLDTAIDHLLDELKTYVKLSPDESDRPSLALPKLPKR